MLVNKKKFAVRVKVQKWTLGTDVLVTYSQQEGSSFPLGTFVDQIKC